MKKYFYRFAKMLVVLVIFVACRPGDLSTQDVLQPTSQFPTTIPEITTPPTAPTPLKEPEDLSQTLINAKGPLLLIQSGLQTYQILDIGGNAAYPFDPPGPAQRYPLAANLSPSGQKMLFSISNTETVVMFLATGEIQKIFDLTINPSHFQPELAAEQALAALPGMKYSFEAMLSSVKDAWTKSMQQKSWFQTDRFLLRVQEGSDTSTHLSLYDLESGTSVPLEQLPGLVEAYWVGPTDDLILLKKGFVFEPGVWQDDWYTLVDRIQMTAIPIPLPNDIDNPTISWFTSSSIGITHQMEPLGGVNFTIVDVNTMTSNQIVTGPFTHILPLGNNLLIVSHDLESNITNLTLQTFDGQVLNQGQIASQCFFKAVVSPTQLLFNCETHSFLLDEMMQTTLFGEIIRIFSYAPNRKTILVVDSNDQTELLDESLGEIQNLILEAPPLEIRWLPDSSGFLYRTSGHVYYYDLSLNESQLLLTSDLFADYQNLNAVWIKIE